VLQIETYAVLLPMLFTDIPRIDEYILMYQTRESAGKWEPYRIEWTEDKRTRALKRLTRWTQGYALAERYLDEGHSDDLLQKIVGQRPCLSKKSYDREMSCKFEKYGGRPCPNVNLCTAYEGRELSRKLYATTQDRIDEHQALIAKQTKRPSTGKGKA
jgi:hypothetical protein